MAYHLQYLYVALFLLVGILLPVGGMATSWLLRPKKPDKVKLDPYECGLPTTGRTWVQYNIRYYMFALVFVVFDVEAVFLYPWAVAFRRLGMFAFIEAVIFIVLLLVGLIYAWKKRVLEWS